MRLMLRPLGRVAEQHDFAKADKLLAERSTSDTLPRCETVRASDDNVEEQARAIDHSRHDGMVDGHVLADASLGAELHSPQKPTDKPDVNLRATVWLRIIRGGLLLG